MRNINMYIKSIAWLLALCLILFAAEKFFDFFLLQNKDLKPSYISSEKINADVLVLGACEAFSTVRPDFVQSITGDKVYNLGTNGSMPSEMYALYYLYLSNNKPPKTLVIQLSELMLDIRFNSFNSYRFAQFNDEHIHEIIKSKDPQYYKAFSIPFGKYAVYNRMFTFNVKEGVLDWYFKAKSSFIDGYYKPFALHVSTQHVINKFGEHLLLKNDSLELMYLEKILELSHKHNIQVKAFNLPMWKGAEPYIINTQQINAELDSVFQKHNVVYRHFSYLNFTNDSSVYLSPFRVNSVLSDSIVGKLFLP